MTSNHGDYATLIQAIAILGLLATLGCIVYRRYLKRKAERRSLMWSNSGPTVYHIPNDPEITEVKIVIDSDKKPVGSVVEIYNSNKTADVKIAFTGEVKLVSLGDVPVSETDITANASGISSLRTSRIAKDKWVIQGSGLT